MGALTIENISASPAKKSSLPEDEISNGAELVYGVLADIHREHKPIPTHILLVRQVKEQLGIALKDARLIVLQMENTYKSELEQMHYRGSL